MIKGHQVIKITWRIGFYFLHKGCDISLILQRKSHLGSLDILLIKIKLELDIVDVILSFLVLCSEILSIFVILADHFANIFASSHSFNLKSFFN